MRPRDSKTPPNAADHAASANAPNATNARRARRSSFNREYQRRAARIALSRVACTLIEDPNSGFYRPSRLAKEVLLKPARKSLKETSASLTETPQLSLDFVRDPLYDLWHDPEEIR